MRRRLVLAALAVALAVPFHAATFDELARRAAQAREANRDQEAIGLYRQALVIQPDWKEGLWFLSTLEYEKERFQDARDNLRRFVANDASAGPGWVLLGMSEFKTRGYGRSLDHLQRGLGLGLGERQDLAHSAFYLLGALFTRAEEYDKSTDLWTRLAMTGNADEFLIQGIGLAALRLPLLPGEIPEDQRDLVQLAGGGACALAANDKGAAEKQFRRMVAGYPNEPGVHFLLGAFLMPDRPDQAIAEMKRELDISPDHVPARIRLAAEYLRQERIDAALPLAEQAVSLAPSFAPAHRAFGEVLVAKGDLDKGIHELETARSAEPAVIETRLALFRAYSAAHRTEDAAREKDAVEKLKQANP